MKNNIIYLLFAFSLLLLNSCVKNKIENELDRINTNSIEHFYQTLGQVNMTVDGQKIDEPLVGLPLLHPSYFEETDTKQLALFTWNIENWINFYRDNSKSTNRKIETFTLTIENNYEGVGRYELNNSTNQVCYSFAYYNFKEETSSEETSFCSDLIADNGYIEITSDKNGRIKGKFTTKAKSSETEEMVTLEGDFDIKYGE